MAWNRIHLAMPRNLGGERAIREPAPAGRGEPSPIPCPHVLAALNARKVVVNELAVKDRPVPREGGDKAEKYQHHVTMQTTEGSAFVL